MKKLVAILLPPLILSAAAFAQNLPKPSLKAIMTAEEKAPDSTRSAAAAEPPRPAAPDSADPAPTQSYRLVLNFEPNSLDLAPLSAAALDSMSAVFARSKNRRYEVHGYTCPAAAGQSKTARLSVQRVERIVDWLIELGVPGENIVTVVNAPKNRGAAKEGCTEDRQVDIISSGTQWRDYKPEPPAPDSVQIDSIKAAVADSLKRTLADVVGVLRVCGIRGGSASVRRPVVPSCCAVWRWGVGSVNRPVTTIYLTLSIPQILFYM